MKIRFAGIVCVLALAGVLAYLHAQTTIAQSTLPTGAIGRYQVVASDIDYTSSGGVLKHKAPIRIDTQTGQTWELTEINDDKTHAVTFYWIKLNELK